MIVPAHFEADAYAGIRRMVLQRMMTRDEATDALARLAGLTADRIALASLLAQAYELFDRVGAHDAFYVVLARGRGAFLLTSDGPLARVGEQLGIAVRYRPDRVIG